MVTKIKKDMKAEVVIVHHTPKSVADDIKKWEPRIDMLPEIVKSELDHFLSYEEAQRRNHAVHRAIYDMVRYGEMKERHVVLHLTDGSGGVKLKDFTFYKTNPKIK